MKKNTMLYNIALISFLIVCCSGQSVLREARITMVGIFAVAILAINMHNMKIKITKSVISLLVIMFILYMAFQVTFSYDKTQTIKYIYIYVSGCFLLLMPRKEDFIKLSIIWIEKICKVAAISIIVNLIIPNLFRDYLFFLVSGGKTSYSRLTNEINGHIFSGIMGEKGEAAFMMVIALTIILGRCAAKERISHKDKIWIGIYLVALLLPAKRMLFIIGGVVCLLYVIFWTKGSKKIKAIVGFGIVALIGVAVVISLPSFNTLLERFMDNSGDDTANGRIYLWNYAMDMFNRKKVFGYGYGSFNKYATARGVILTNEDVWVSHAHNIYYQLLGETGIIGFLLFLTIALCGLVIFFKLFNRRNIMETEDKALLFFGGNVQILILLYGFSGNVIYYPNQMMFYFMALAIMIYLQRKYVKSYDK